MLRVRSPPPAQSGIDLPEDKGTSAAGAIQAAENEKSPLGALHLGGLHYFFSAHHLEGELGGRDVGPLGVDVRELWGRLWGWGRWWRWWRWGRWWCAVAMAVQRVLVGVRAATTIATTAGGAGGADVAER